MKQVLLLIVLTGFSLSLFATTYYSQGSLSPNSLISWNTSRSGGASVPSSFTQAGDVFVIQSGHSMVTTTSWTIGNSGSTLQVESGAFLQATFPIFLTGSFQLLNGATYYHENTGVVTSTAGTSIFGGTENFAVTSTVEIRNWINNTTTLPSGINWGNLVLNYEQSIGGNWNQQGALTTIQGNFIVKRTGTALQDFRFTNNTNLNLSIGGDLIIEQAILLLKEGNSGGTSSIVQVNGGITVNGGTLNLGAVDQKPNNELRFKGNFFVFGNGVVTASSEDPFLVANGTGAQTLLSSGTVNCSFRIAKGAFMKLNSALTLGTNKSFIVAGTVVAGINPIIMGGGSLVVSGGVFNSSAKVDMKDGTCQVCQGNGSFNVSTNWCATSGDTGIINFSVDTILFNRSVASNLRIGATGSKGKLLVTNNGVISFSGTISGPPQNRGTIDLTGNSFFSLDENSVVRGDAFYNGNGGWLVLGASPGLTSSGQFGNFQITGSRNYNNGGVNSFEFKSSLPQFTGNSFPSTIQGTFRVTNSSFQGLTLQSAVTIASGAVLELTNGKVKTNSGFILSMNRGSTLLGGSATAYVDGPMRKTGETAFTYHVGKQNRYSPVTLRPNGSSGVTDTYVVEYFPGDPTTIYGNNLSQFIDHISSAEYWNITGSAVPRFIKFKITPYSGVTDFPTLVGSYFDGSSWLNLFNGSTTGTTSNGSFEVSANNFGPFTFGSTSAATNALSSLPVSFLSFNARKAGTTALLNWSISGDVDADYFEVQGSYDNQQFQPIATVKAIERKTDYSYSGITLRPGVNYYRIKAVEKTGRTLFTKVAALVLANKGIEILRASPSIITNQTSLQVSSSTNTAASFLLTDVQGRVVYQTMATLMQGVTEVKVNLSSIAPGVYYWHAISVEGRSNVIKIIKQ